MEFNDSTVRNFNFEKIKEECYGGDGKSGGAMEDAWSGGASWGGSYGKSAYMLIYERRKKKPVKLLVSPEEAKLSALPDIYFDEKKDEYYRLVDYKTGVEEITPSSIYTQVFEDNQKFEFDNDIYSQEFFDFVKSILSASKSALKETQDEKLKQEVKGKAIQVGKKTVMELLAKCFHNTAIKPLCEILIELMKEDEGLCETFLGQCMEEDQCNYLLEIMLECSDMSARNEVSRVVKYVVERLKERERDRLFEVE
jgi:hypothetical protein